MTAVGVPLGQDQWWNRCTWPDGSPVHILTKEDLSEIISKDYEELIEKMADELCKRMQETLNKIITEGEINDPSLH